MAFLSSHRLRNVVTGGLLIILLLILLKATLTDDKVETTARPLTRPPYVHRPPLAPRPPSVRPVLPSSGLLTPPTNRQSGFTFYPNITVYYPSETVMQNYDPDDDDQIKIAYLFLIHSDDTALGAARVLRRIYHLKHTFVIHFDRKIYNRAKKVQNIVLHYFDVEMRAFMVRYNVYFVSYHSVVWGGVSIFQAELDILQIALESGRYWDYAVMLSGNCYPADTTAGLEGTIRALRGPKHLRDKFDWRSYETLETDGWDYTKLPKLNEKIIEAGLINPTAELLAERGLHNWTEVFAATNMFWTNMFSIHGFGASIQPDWKLERYIYVCIETERDIWCDPDLAEKKKAEPNNRVLAKYFQSGSQWFTLGRPFAEWLMHSRYARNVIMRGFTSYILEEQILHILAYSSPWRAHSVWEETTFPMPSRPERWDIEECHTNHPCDITPAMVGEIIREKNFWPNDTVPAQFRAVTFARKFNPLNESIYNLLDSQLGNDIIFGPDAKETCLDDTWWWQS